MSDHPKDIRDVSAVPSARRPRIGRFLVLAVLGLGVAAGFGIFKRARSETELSKWTVARSIASVDLVTPQHATQDLHIVLPADLAAFYTAPSTPLW